MVETAIISGVKFWFGIMGFWHKCCDFGPVVFMLAARIDNWYKFTVANKNEMILHFYKFIYFSFIILKTPSAF